jgi:PAS domain S-box-containing protein
MTKEGVPDPVRLERMINATNALVFAVDAQHQVMLFNDAMAALTGLAAAQVVGCDLLRWIPDEQQGDFLSAFRRALGGEPVVGFDLLLVGPSASVRGNFSLASDERAEWVIAVGQDRTAIRILEHQVFHAEKLATLGQIAAGVVHEINNPLTSITVYADYLLKKFKRDGGGGDAGDVAMLEKILDGSNRILKCTRDLVDYAKPSGDRLDVLSLNEVVDQSASFCEHIVQKAGASLQIERAEELSPLYGVRDQLLQMLVNLITNACHALPATGGEVRIRTRDLHNGDVAVEVSDTGCGIEQADLPRIFEPFFTTKVPGEGTGLGLSIVKKIAESHEGNIVVESRVGEGSRFCITLPTKQRHRG